MSTETKTLESNLKYIRSTYKKLLYKNLIEGKPVDRYVERLKSVEIQLWMVREGVGTKDKASSGS